MIIWINSSLFYDAFEKKLYAFRNPGLETQCDDSNH